MVLYPIDTMAREFLKNKTPCSQEWQAFKIFKICRRNIKTLTEAEAAIKKEYKNVDSDRDIVLARQAAKAKQASPTTPIKRGRPPVGAMAENHPDTPVNHQQKSRSVPDGEGAPVAMASAAVGKRSKNKITPPLPTQPQGTGPRLQSAVLLDTTRTTTTSIAGGTRTVSIDRTPSKPQKLIQLSLHFKKAKKAITQLFYLTQPII